MKKSNIITGIIFLVLICLFSCGKDMAPAKIPLDGKLQTYDSARFDYFFIEAVKQKLMGNSGEALQRLEQCLKINPGSDAAYFQKAQVVMGLGDNIRGKIYARKAHTLAPDNFWYLMMLAGIYYNENNIDSTIIFYEKAVVLYPEKENLLLNLGNLYSANGNYENADLIFKRLDQKYGINETSTVASIKNLMMTKKYNEALEKTNLLLIEYPDEILYNGFLAEIYHAMGENEKATNVYKELLVKNPEDPSIHISYCDFLLNSGNYNELF
jgi:predicted Zn-dependent protease